MAADKQVARIVHRPGQRPLLQMLKKPEDVSVDASAMVAASDRLAAAIREAAGVLAAALAASTSTEAIGAVTAAVGALSAAVSAKDVRVDVAPASVAFSPQITAVSGETRVAVESRVTADVKLPPPRNRVARVTERGGQTEIAIGED